MRVRHHLLYLPLFLVTASLSLAQSTFSLRMVGDSVKGGNFYVTIEMKSNNATFKLGSSALFFDYNALVLNAPDVEATFNYIGFLNMTPICPNNCVYTNNFQLSNTVGRTGIGINLGLANFGAIMPLNWIPLAQLKFQVLDFTIVFVS